MTSVDESFTPRKEFIREHRPYFNSFSLLTVSRANLVRLYSFPPPVVTALRQFLDQFKLLVGFRENATSNYYEISLEGKPWAAPKSIASETLLLSILTIIYNHGHSYSSTIDYGREQDDRLFMVFQRTIPQPVNSPPGSMRTPSPNSPIGTTDHASTTTLDLHNKRIPFALSFPSATVLRVINPPLHSTPAILQAVRSSWPRGVISEKKIGEVAFEFKLKGYKCASLELPFQVVLLISICLSQGTRRTRSPQIRSTTFSLSLPRSTHTPFLSSHLSPLPTALVSKIYGSLPAQPRRQLTRCWTRLLLHCKAPQE